MCLSTYSPTDLVGRIASGDVGALKRIKGIGEKTAQRIIVDLKDKIGKSTGIPAFSIEKITAPGYNKTREEALGALVMLGFVRIQAEKAVDRSISTMEPGAPVEEVIKQALKHL
jgi:Holliday junction DNA helicase RuvA